MENYNKYFKYKIYECFKPETLKQTRNYVEFLTTYDPDSNGCTVSEEDLSPELYSYLSKDMETQLPRHINQKRLLQFDSNFESGNLDSAYLVSEAEYNLLCKVDTNTKGNTYWFYFKVLNWRAGSTVTFNLLNVARDLAPFYSRGMQVLTRTESASGKLKTPWVAEPDICRVVSFLPNDIGRTTKKTKEYAMGRTFHTLIFKCTFPPVQVIRPPPDSAAAAEGSLTEHGAPGTVFCFAYALPLTYSDLLSDLENARKFLLASGGSIIS